MRQDKPESESAKFSGDFGHSEAFSGLITLRGIPVWTDKMGFKVSGEGFSNGSRLGQTFFVANVDKVGQPAGSTRRFEHREPPRASSAVGAGASGQNRHV